MKGIGIICGVVLVVLLGAVLVAYLVRKNRQENTRATWQPSEGVTRPNGAVETPNELDPMFNKLADLLLDLRVSGASQSVFDAARRIVDVLADLLPKFTESYGHTELAFVLIQIGKNYLPNLLSPYSKLSRPTQQEKEGELLDAIAVLTAEIANVQEIYDRGEVNRFETEATLLKHKFLRTTIEASS